MKVIKSEMRKLEILFFSQVPENAFYLMIKYFWKDFGQCGIRLFFGNINIYSFEF